MEDRVRILSEEIVSDEWARLTRYTLEYRRSDGQWDRQVRQVFDRGDGATILPYDPSRGTVLLVKQFRLPAYVTGYREMLIEACAGLLDDDAPEECIRREAEEELGYRLRDVKFLFAAYSSVGSLTERLHYFTAEYLPTDRITTGGGEADEGEDIEVLEMTLDEAHAAVMDGRIIDAKTILLIQHLRLGALSNR